MTSPSEPHLAPDRGESTADELYRQVYRFSDLSEYPRKQRWRIKAAGLISYVLLGLTGRTVRWTIVDWEHYEALRREGRQIIFTFWHQCIFMATWFWRRRGIVVMTSRSADGEIMGRIIQRFGYGSARGSSSHGAGAALRQMVACSRQGWDAAFTIDGPRGPKYVAKPGAVRLAKSTGQAILPFHISARRRWEANSWDRFQIPYPFTQGVVLLGKPIMVSSCEEQEFTRCQSELQRTLDELRERAEDWWQE